jgi:hypothetical protein
MLVAEAEKSTMVKTQIEQLKDRVISLRDKKMDLSRMRHQIDLEEIDCRRMLGMLVYGAPGDQLIFKEIGGEEKLATILRVEENTWSEYPRCIISCKGELGTTVESHINDPTHVVKKLPRANSVNKQ